MSAVPELLTRPHAADQYVVSFGKGGGVGVFTAHEPMPLLRGDRVVVRSPRGIEAGSVLCAATLGQARLLGATAAGPLLRPLGTKDDALLRELRPRARQLFEAARQDAREQCLALEILDVEILLDEQQAILQFVGDEPQLDGFAQLLEQRFGLQIRLENLAQPSAPSEEAEHGGCGKPDCGRAEGGEGGCTTCSTGGGCSSCASGSKVDLRDYFGHLREKMQKDQRLPLN
jgi:cell fate regulator YaaT (PSP1 superfamily)